MRRSSLALFLLLAACTPSTELPRFGTVPAFELTAQNGQPFQSATQLTGKVWVAGFIFTECPGPCPRMTSKMRKIQRELAAARDFRLVSVTIDPQRDTPTVLSAYAKRFDADENQWFFLTGSRANLHHLSKDVFHLADVDERLEHSSKLVLVDRTGQIRGYYDSSEEGVQKLLEDARRLLA